MDSTPAETSVQGRLNRTCEGCRRRKIKCIPGELNTSSFSSTKCQRCTKLHLDCTFHGPVARRKRKNNNAKIRELEQKLEDVQRSIQDEQTLGNASSATQSASDGSRRRYSAVQSSGFPAYSEHVSPSLSKSHSSTHQDPVTLGTISESLAMDLCTHFCAHQLPHYPLVSLPGILSLSTIRCEHPALFRVMLAAAATCSRPDLSTFLHEQAEEYVTRQAVRSGKKSLDLIQATLVLATWSRPPDNFRELNFGQFATIATSMVTDLRFSNDSRYQIGDRRMDLRAENSLEVARTFTAAYILSSSIAMSFQRPSSLRSGKWLDECLCVLDTSPSTRTDDRRLSAWARLQILAEEGLTMAGIDEGAPVKPSDPRSCAILQGVTSKLRSWRSNIDENLMNKTLEMHYNTILLVFSITELYEKYEIQDFRPPFAIQALPSTAIPISSSLQYIDARARCLATAHTMIKHFHGFTFQELQQVPVIIYTRLMFSLVVITKLAIFHTPSSEVLGTDFTAAMKALRDITERIAIASDVGRFRVPATFHAVLQRLLSRCDVICWGDKNQLDDLIEPLMDLTVKEPPEAPDTLCQSSVQQSDPLWSISTEEMDAFHLMFPDWGVDLSLDTIEPHQDSWYSI